VTAQSILDRPFRLEMVQCGDQVEAIESLLVRGHEFSNIDLTWISFVVQN
jgi:hypothetical protein